jgi:hypothetical protein
VNQGARVVARKRLLEIGDDAILMVPKSIAGERRQDTQAIANAGARGLEVGFEPRGERFRPMKAENRPAAGVGLQKIGEAGLDAGGLIAER